MDINTILFDLDGTLIDTAPDLAYALNILLSENGLEKKLYNDIKPLVSFGGKALVSMGFDCDEAHPEFSKRHQRLLEIYTDNIDKHSVTFPDIDALIMLIKKRGLFWGIVLMPAFLPAIISFLSSPINKHDFGLTANCAQA
jgi:phosphoglycolate phosphatase